MVCTKNTSCLSTNYYYFNKHKNNIMKIQIKTIFSALILVIVIVYLAACNESNTPKVKVFKVEPSKFVLVYGDSIVMKATLDGQEVKAEWQIIPEGVVSIDSTGKVKALKVGKGSIAATYKDYSAKADFEITSVEYFLPYLRMFDDEKKIYEYETSLGHTIEVKDSSLAYYMFSTNSEVLPQVAYIAGKAIQMFTTKDVLTSRQFIDYMASKGFTTDGQILYGYMMAYKSPFKTVSAYAILDTIPNYPLKTGMCFNVVNPILEAIPYPELDWNASLSVIQAKEGSKGYTLSDIRTDNLGRKEYIYGKRKETTEFTEMFITRYLFDTNNKLIKSTLIIIPAHYVFTPMGTDAFSINPKFLTLASSQGYVETNMTGDASRKVYSNSEKDNKFTLRSWRIKIGGYMYIGAGLDFVPYNGPDEID